MQVICCFQGVMKILTAVTLVVLQIIYTFIWMIDINNIIEWGWIAKGEEWKVKKKVKTNQKAREWK